MDIPATPGQGWQSSELRPGRPSLWILILLHPIFSRDTRRKQRRGTEHICVPARAMATPHHPPVLSSFPAAISHSCRLGPVDGTRITEKSLWLCPLHFPKFSCSPLHSPLLGCWEQAAVLSFGMGKPGGSCPATELLKVLANKVKNKKTSNKELSSHFQVSKKHFFPLVYCFYVKNRSKILT